MGRPGPPRPMSDYEDLRDGGGGGRSGGGRHRSSSKGRKKSRGRSSGGRKGRRSRDRDSGGSGDYMDGPPGGWDGPPGPGGWDGPPPGMGFESGPPPGFMGGPPGMGHGKPPPPPGWRPLGPEGHRDISESYFSQEGGKVFWGLVWIAGTAWAGYANWVYWRDVRADLYAFLGVTLLLARFGAAVEYVNVSLVFVPVSRNFITFLRGSFFGSMLPFDKNIVFHKRIAFMIAAGALVHTAAHYFNFYKIENRPLEDLNAGFADKEGNPAEFTEETRPTAFQLTFMLTPGYTGQIMIISMLFMYTSALARIRKPSFETFWYTHHLFLPFLGAALWHGTASLLGEPPKMWYFGAGPGGIYILERLLRYYRANERTRIVKIIAHPSDVVEIRFQKEPRFDYRCGQYLFLQCPAVSQWQWHPFTISSAPEEPFASVHVRQAGDFTKALAMFLVPSLNVEGRQFPSPGPNDNIIKIDGPFGAASEEVFDYEVVVLVGAGVGVTPFASILKSVKYRVKDMHGSAKLTYIPFAKAYFFWICKDKTTFEWFTELLASLEKEALDKRRVLEIHTYLTEKMGMDEIRQVVYTSGKDKKSRKKGEGDAITGLRSPTHFGRPNWERIFYQMYQDHAGSTIGVFLCGPGPLSKSVYGFCRKFSDGYTTFKFSKENF